MLKKVIRFTDLNGKDQEETHYFHLSKADLLRLELEHNGYENYVKSIVASGDGRRIMALFESLILKSYGRRSDDGSKFIKDDYVTQEFQNTPAYEALYVELVTDPDAAAAFFNGIAPSDLSRIVRPKRAGKGAGGHKPKRSRNLTPQEETDEALKIADWEEAQKKLRELGLAEENPEPILLTPKQIVEMDSDELRSGINSGKYRIP